MVEKITNHIAAARARLISQYKNKPKINGMLDMSSQQFQDLENTFFDLMTKRGLWTAEGVQLDRLGDIVGWPREGLNDDEYRIMIIGKIGINISQGNPEDLIRVLKLLLHCNKVHYLPIYPAGVSLMGSGVLAVSGQLLADGDMEAEDTNAWWPLNGAVVTKETGLPYSGSRSLRIAYNGTPNPGVAQYQLTPDKYYWLNGRVRTSGTGGKPVVRDNGAVLMEYTSFADWYEIDVVFKATSDRLDLSSDFISADWVEYDQMELVKLNLDNAERIYRVCEMVVPAGVRLWGIGWYEGTDDEAKYFGFEDDPDALGFGDVNDPRVGGKLASLFYAYPPA